MKIHGKARLKRLTKIQVFSGLEEGSFGGSAGLGLEGMLIQRFSWVC
jgi:hypothetical protein